MTYEAPALSSQDRERLSRLEDVTTDSRSLFDTFVLHADYLIRFTDDLLRRADTIEFPEPPDAPSVSRSGSGAPQRRVIRLDERAAGVDEPDIPVAHRRLAQRIGAPAQPGIARRNQQPPPAPKPPSGPAPPQEKRASSLRTAPVVLVIGPVDRLGEIENLTLELESVPEMDIHFRLFRAGAYRVDASCSDIEGLTARLRARKDVLSVDRQGPTIHVLPAPLTL